MKKLFYYALFSGNLVILTYFWWQSSGEMMLSGDSSSIGIAVARLAGLLATQLALTQLILIGRIKWIESIFGLDKLSRVHKWNGYGVLALTVLHVALLANIYAYLSEISFVEQLFVYIKYDDDFLKAFLAYLILLGTVFLSITIVRKNLKYEWWYWVHLFNYTVFVLFVSHQINFGSSLQNKGFQYYWLATYAFTALHIAWFRFGKPILNYWQHRFTVGKVEDLGPATNIYITGKNLEKFLRQSGQFMIFRFFQKGLWYEAHPFSLSWSADNLEIRITAKKLGDFTTKKLPTLAVGTQVLIDGPHGIFTSKQIKKDKVLMIAGGIGITPIRSLVEEVSGKVDLTLIYSAKTKAEAVLLNELKDIQGKTNYKLIEIYTDEQVEGAQFGRLDKDRLQALVPDLASRDVYLCGPPPMMNALKKAMAELGLPKKQLHWEKFAL